MGRNHPDSENRPKLRCLEPVPIVVQGVQSIALKDPLRMSENMICIQQQVLPVLAMLDGRNSLLDIQAEMTRRAGRIVFMDEIKSLIDRLDQAFLLEGDRFQQEFNRKVAEYRKRPYREPAHAGTSYSSDPETLKKDLQLFFTGEGGPGMPDFFSSPRRPVGLIAPHIDIRAGSRCFAKAYYALASGKPSDIYIIFGTGHSGVQEMFTATNLDFKTPLGTVTTDRDFIDKLSKELGRDCAAEEILHASEHVIEFQVIFLQYMFSDRHNFSIVPILCSFSPHIFQSGNFKSQKEAFQGFCEAVREICRSSSKTVCFIASADLDHIGPRYGDTFIPHKGTIQSALERDGRLLACLERLDLDAFVHQVSLENDSSRICGFSPITVMLQCMEASEGTILALDYAHVDNRNSFVSFSSMIFH